LFFAWYTKFVTYKIFGKFSETIGLIVDKGITPAAWDKRLIKSMNAAHTDGQKKIALNKHLRYLDGEFKNLHNFTLRSSFIDDDERDEVLEALQRFQEDYINNLKDKIDN
jgi:uncharacterized coiled-coil protein SlyX